MHAARRSATAALFGAPFITWRGLPVAPRDKAEAAAYDAGRHATTIVVHRTGELLQQKKANTGWASSALNSDEPHPELSRETVAFRGCRIQNVTYNKRSALLSLRSARSPLGCAPTASWSTLGARVIQCGGAYSS